MEAQMLTQGFTSQLEGWWERLQTLDQQREILYTTRTELKVENDVNILPLNLVLL